MLIQGDPRPAACTLAFWLRSASRKFGVAVFANCAADLAAPCGPNVRTDALTHARIATRNASRFFIRFPSLEQIWQASTHMEVVAGVSCREPASIGFIGV